MKQEELDFLTRKLLDINACVIAVSSSPDGWNLHPDSSMDTDECVPGIPWVNLCTQLPKYVPSPRTRAAVDCCPNAGIKTILDLCLESNPLFAGTSAGLIEEYLSDSQKSFLDFIERFRRLIVSRVLQSKPYADLPEGCFGYLLASLSAGNPLTSVSEGQMRLFRNFSYTNWAYMVNDKEVIEFNAADSPSAKRVRLTGATVSVRPIKPTFVLLWRSRSNSNLYLKGPNDEEHTFNFATLFPDPKEDLPFYLGLAGSESQPGHRVYVKRGPRGRVSTAKLVQLVNLPPNDTVAGFQNHEALVCAAFFTASNAGSISGCALEELVTGFVEELIVTSNDNGYARLTTVDHIPLDGEFRARFLFPFGSQLPAQVHEILGTAQIEIRTKGECLEAVSYIPDASGKRNNQVLIYARSQATPEFIVERIRTALQSEEHKVVFIVVENILDPKLRGFDTQKNGLDARIFLVQVDKSLKVCLRALDGAPRNSFANRVILIISVAEINMGYSERTPNN